MHISSRNVQHRQSTKLYQREGSSSNHNVIRITLLTFMQPNYKYNSYISCSVVAIGGG